MEKTEQYNVNVGGKYCFPPKEKNKANLTNPNGYSFFRYTQNQIKGIATGLSNLFHSTP